jgi:Tfp pilus assembly protein PilF
MAYEKSAHAENSYQNFKNAIMHQPQNAFAYEAFCASLFERGLDREARVQCQKALSLNPDLCSAHYRLADHYVALFNADLAHDHCRRYLLCDDKSAETKLTQNRCRDILATVKAHGS